MNTLSRVTCMAAMLGCLPAVCAQAQEAHAAMQMIDHMNDDPLEYMVLLDRLEIRAPVAGRITRSLY